MVVRREAEKHSLEGACIDRAAVAYSNVDDVVGDAITLLAAAASSLTHSTAEPPLHPTFALRTTHIPPPPEISPVQFGNCRCRWRAVLSSCRPPPERLTVRRDNHHRGQQLPLWLAGESSPLPRGSRARCFLEKVGGSNFNDFRHTGSRSALILFKLHEIWQVDSRENH